MQVSRHFFGQWQEPCIKPFDLVDRGSSILCKVEDVYLPLAVDDSHADRRVAQGVEGMLLTRGFIDLNLAHLQDLTKLTLDDIRNSGPIVVLREEDEVFGRCIWIPVLDPLVD